MLRWPPDVSVDISWFEILTSFYLTTGWRCPIKTGGIGAKTNYIHPLWWSSGYSTAWFEKSRFPANPLLEKFAAKCVNYCWSWHPANIFFMQMLLDVENRTENSNGCMAYLAGPSFRSSLRQWIWCGMIFLTEWTVGFAQTYSCQWVGCSHWCQRLRWKITALRDGYATKAWWKSYVQGAMWRWIISLQSFRRSLDISLHSPVPATSARCSLWAWIGHMERVKSWKSFFLWVYTHPWCLDCHYAMTIPHIQPCSLTMAVKIHMSSDPPFSTEPTAHAFHVARLMMAEHSDAVPSRAAVCSHDVGRESRWDDSGQTKKTGNMGTKYN